MTRVAALLVLVLPAGARAADPKPERVITMRHLPSEFSTQPNRAELVAIDPVSGAVKALTPEPFRTRYDAPLAVSPDGTRAAFQYASASPKDRNAPLVLTVLALDDPKAVPKALPVTGDPVCFTPDGKHLVVVEDADGRKAHHLIDMKTLEAKEFELPKTEKPKDAKGRWGHVVLDITPDGKHWLTKTIAGDQRETATGLYLVPRDGGGEPKRIEGAFPAAHARFSPDGQTILFLLDSKSGDGKLYTLPTAGGAKPKPVRCDTGSILTARSFGWSPDGKRVAFVAWLYTTPKSELHMPAVLLADPDGKSTKTLVRTINSLREGWYSPVWR